MVLLPIAGMRSLLSGMPGLLSVSPYLGQTLMLSFSNEAEAVGWKQREQAGPRWLKKGGPCLVALGGLQRQRVTYMPTGSTGGYRNFVSTRNGDSGWEQAVWLRAPPDSFEDGTSSAVHMGTCRRSVSCSYLCIIPLAEINLPSILYLRRQEGKGLWELAGSFMGCS